VAAGTEQHFSQMTATSTEIADIERALGVKFSDRHTRALIDSSDPIHEACDFLVVSSPHELLRILEVNHDLHCSDNPDPWPSHLVAFASNGCGDYFALRLHGSGHYSILYVDPDRTVEENLSSEDQSLKFATFDEWYFHKIAEHKAL